MVFTYVDPPERHLRPLSDLEHGILKELRKDPHASNSVLAKRLGQPVSVVSARIRSLARRKLSRILTVLDWESTHQRFCLVKIQVRSCSVSAVAQELVEMNQCLMASALRSGSHDLLCSLKFHEYRDLEDLLFNSIANIAGVHNLDISMVVSVPIFRSEYIAYTTNFQPEALEDSIERLRSELVATSIDEIDLNIIASLQHDSRYSINAIADANGISASTVRYRIRNLVASGLVKYVLAVDSSALAISVVCYLEMSIEVSKIHKAVEFLKTKDWLPHLFFCAGSYSVTGMIYARDLDHLQEIRSMELSSVEGLYGYSVAIIDRMYKNDLRWAFNFTDT